MSTNLPNFIARLSPQELGAHIENYYELYTRPVASWKKAYSQRRSGYDFTILNIIYYLILAFFLFQDVYFAAKVVLLEILVTLFPLLIFITPFLISTKIFKIHKKWTKLFRVFLIIKFQLIPPLVLLILLARWSELESLYLLFENGLLIGWLGFILVVPLISSISSLRKVAWIALNYVFLLLGFFMFVLLFSFLDNEDKLFSKLQINTPNQEYLNVRDQSFYSIYRFDDKGYVAIFEIVDNEFALLKKTQFATPELALIITTHSRNENIKQHRLVDSLLTVLDPNHVSISYELDSVIKLTNCVLDSISEETNRIFYGDLELYQKAKESSKFESNKKYFQTYIEYLNHYKQLYNNSGLRNNIVRELRPQSSAYISNNEVVSYYVLRDPYLFERKEELNSIRNNLDNRRFKAEFMMNLIFFPLYKIM